MFAVDELPWRKRLNAVTLRICLQCEEVKNYLEYSNILHQNMIHRLLERSKFSGIYSC